MRYVVVKGTGGKPVSHKMKYKRDFGTKVCRECKNYSN